MSNTQTTLIKLREANIITPSGTINKQSKKLFVKFPQLEQLLLEETAFLPNNAGIRERIFALHTNLNYIPVCKVCNTPTSFNHQKNLYNKYCANVNGRSCAMQDKNISEQIHATNREVRGVDHPQQSLGVREKTTVTNLKKYGHRFPTQSPEVQEKIKKTVLSRYNQSNVSKVNDIKLKRATTNTDRYGATTWAGGKISPTTVEWFSNCGNLVDALKDFCVDEIALTNQVSPQYVRQWIVKHGLTSSLHPHWNAPLSVRKLLSWISNITSVPVIYNAVDIIPGHRIDIWIPSSKLAIQYIDVSIDTEGNGIPRYQHRDVCIGGQLTGIRVVHILSTEWRRSEELVKSRLSAILGISSRVYARQCVVRKLEGAELSQFFNHNHIQQHQVCSVAYGLVHNGKVVAGMSFTKSRYDKDVQWELLRFCSVIGLTVVGGASKLFSHFIKTHDPLNIVSYCDKRWGNGNLYTQLGFTHKHSSSPNYFYYHTSDPDTTLMSRVQFQKHKLAEKLSVFNPELTEWENMRANGYDRVWDCGNLVYQKELGGLED